MIVAAQARNIIKFFFTEISPAVLEVGQAAVTDLRMLLVFSHRFRINPAALAFFTARLFHADNQSLDFFALKRIFDFIRFCQFQLRNNQKRGQILAMAIQQRL